MIRCELRIKKIEKRIKKIDFLTFPKSEKRIKNKENRLLDIDA